MSDRPTVISSKTVWECKLCGSHQQSGNGECSTCLDGKHFLKKIEYQEEEIEIAYDSRPELIPLEPSEQFIAKQKAEKIKREFRHKKIQQVKKIALVVFGLVNFVLFIFWAVQK